MPHTIGVRRTFRRDKSYLISNIKQLKRSYTRHLKYLIFEINESKNNTRHAY